MNADAILDFYENLGFEEVEIEDGLTALCFETDSTEPYVLLTDEDGAMPQDLNNPIVFAYYTAEGAFLWSKTFKTSLLFRERWIDPQTFQEKLTLIQSYREKAKD